jgi:photosynthetic reaction center cytochrome c subunit
LKGTATKRHRKHKNSLPSLVLLVPFCGYFPSLLMFICLLAVESASAQAGQQPKPLMVEDVFKNVQVLKGIPVDEFMDTMGFFAAALSLNCTECHTPESENSWAKYADDTPLKQTSRRMMQMVTAINRQNFGGARAVTCYTCHHGTQRPKTVPSLVVQYSAPVEDPDEAEVTGQASAAPILDKYIQAVGGGSLTSLAVKGTYAGYDTYHQKVAMEIYAQAPDRVATVIHEVGPTRADSVKVYDGRAGWIVSENKPVHVMPLTGGNVAGARLDAVLLFPAQLKQAFTQWRTGTATIDDHDVQVVQGTNPGQPPVKLYFDPNSGLLLRVVRYSDTAIGRVPTQIDYADYRDVSGVKIPFRWTVTWTDNQTFIQLNEVRTNVPIDASRFARPAQ